MGRLFGDGSAAEDLRTALTTAGHTVSHFGINPFTETLEYENRVWRFPGHYRREVGLRATDQPQAFIRSMRDLNRFALPVVDVARSKADVIHLHTELAMPAIEEIRRHTKIPMVYTQHTVNRVQLELSRCNSVVARLLVTMQDRAIETADEWTAPSALKSNSTRQPVIIPHAIGHRHPIQNRSAGRVPTILYVGRLTAIKGIDLLLDALDLVSRQFRLVVVGTGPRLEEYRQRASDLGIDALFTGQVPREELWGIYAQADIFVCPTEFDTYNLTVDEAMASGLPVLASEIDALRGRIESGSTGILCRRDKDTFAECITYLIDHPKERRKLGSAAQKKLASRSIETAYAYLEVYSRALEGAAELRSPLSTASSTAVLNA
ncbi:glycosyltransferase family 4 protein [Microlunatus elymi]|nr:glycosyltransferase family 4 protein [Microlunatus elymi]